jgi:hypothetical protein
MIEQLYEVKLAFREKDWHLNIESNTQKVFFVMFCAITE